MLKMAFVSARYYAGLQLACESDMTGRDHADYLTVINESREKTHVLGIPFAIIHINPEMFSLWCGNEKTTRDDLLHYAGSTCFVQRMMRDDSGKPVFPESSAVTAEFVAAHTQ